jgi:hypothetical protein
MGSYGCEILLEALAAEEDQKIRSRLLQVLSRLDSIVFVACAQQKLSDERWYVIRNVFTILFKMNVSEIPETFLAAVNHPEPGSQRTDQTNLQNELKSECSVYFEDAGTSG